MLPVVDMLKQSLRSQEHPLWFDKEVRFDTPGTFRQVNTLVAKRVLQHGEFLAH